MAGQQASGLTRGHDVGHALAGRQEDQELPKVGEHAEVQEEHQREVEEGGGAQIEPCMDSSMSPSPLPALHASGMKAARSLLLHPPFD